MPRVIVKIPEKKADAFEEFLRRREGVDSFQRFEQTFLVKVMLYGEEDYQRFLEEAGKLFLIEHIRPLCQVKCLDNTDCLNSAKENNRCWKHRL